MQPLSSGLGHHARVLVVDDEAVICDILKDVLQYEGFRVETAPTGETAFKLLAREPFDLLLTDLKMPGMDGLELLQRSTDLGRDMLTIIMTGFGTVETAVEALKGGAFDYILKPFRPEDVVRVLRRGLEKQRLERENIALRETISFYELSEALSSAMPIDEQLRTVVNMVRDNFGADGVSIVVEDPENQGTFLERTSFGQARTSLKTPAIMEHFRSSQPVLAVGPEVGGWVADPVTPDRAVKSFMSAPLRNKGRAFGMINAFSFTDGHHFTEGQRKGLSVFGGRAADAILADRAQGALRLTFTQTIEGLARALEAKDAYTHGHSDRVAMYAKLIAKAMGLPEPEVDRVEHGGLMHDIGKIGIRSSELNKPQKLTPAEYLMFKSHPVVGRRIIEPIKFLAYVIPCVYHHHEAYDGSGYPEGLHGEGIPLEARVLTVADSYDAMTSDRPYRKALPHDLALAELKRCSGRQFDPEVVRAFLGLIEDFRAEQRERGESVPY